MADKSLADLGTVAHKVLEQCLELTYALELPTRASAYEGQSFEVEDKPHKRLSPSSAERFIHCAAAPNMEAHFLEETHSPRRHSFESDYVQAVQACLDYVADRYQNIKQEYGPVVVRTEQKVSPARFLHTSECDGTFDVLLVADGFVELIDFKAGSGVFVDAGTPQLQLYFLGVCAEYANDNGLLPFKQARLTICQPRHRGTEPVRSVEIENVGNWLTEKVPFFLKAIAATNEETPVFNPSEETCRWCKASGACSAYQHYALSRAGVLDLDATTAVNAFSQLDERARAYAARDVTLLTGIELRRILDAESLVVGALKAVRLHVLALLEKGAAPEEVMAGYKLVHGRSKRHWAYKDPEIEKRLKRIKITDPETGKLRALGKKDLMETKLRSVPGMEKLLKAFQIPNSDARWQAFEALVAKSTGALTLAPLSDSRPDVSPSRTDPDQAFSEEPPAPSPGD